MDRIARLHVVEGNVLLVCQRFAGVDQTNHGNVDALLLLQGLLDLQNRVRWLKIKRLLHSSQRLSTNPNMSQPTT